MPRLCRCDAAAEEEATEMDCGAPSAGDPAPGSFQPTSVASEMAGHLRALELVRHLTSAWNHCIRMS